MRGFHAKLAPDGYVVVTLEHSADPSKDSKEWLDARHKDMGSDDQGFTREYLLDWTSSQGDWFYSVFARDPMRFVAETPFFPKLPILRGWDFGHRHPACTWSQFGTDGRLRVLRSLMVADIDVHSFRDLVLYLSGQDLIPGAPPEIQIRQLERRPRAIEELARLEKDPPLWEGWMENKISEFGMPFFPRGGHFMDFAGHEVNSKKSFYSVEGERSDSEVLATAGINISVLWQPESYGVRIIRRLLLDHPDGNGPGLILDPRNEDLINGMAGGLVWPADTAAHQEIDKGVPAEDGYYEHLHDCLRYTCINIVDVAEGIESVQSFTPMRSAPSPTEELMEKANVIRSNEVMFDKWNDLDDEKGGWSG